MKNLFKNGKLRFGIETFLVIYLNRYQFVLGSDLESYAGNKNESFNDDNPCNIYFVLRRPKVTVDPDSIKIKGKKAHFNLLVHLKEQIGVIPTMIKFKHAKSKIEYITEYPYNIMAFRDQESALMVARPSSLIDSSLVSNNLETDDLDFEILYIGQAYGKDGSRNAFDRLANHETLQKIYSHSLTTYPDSDIWIMLADFSQQSILFSAPQERVRLNKSDKDIDDNKVKHMFDNNGLSITEKQRINFIEAGLIKYFEPEYNRKFKGKFPHSKHSSYSECYELDIRALNLELDTREMKRKIFTKKTGRKLYHSHMFEFKNANDRISLMDI
jgi:hypothetical protein